MGYGENNGKAPISTAGKPIVCKAAVMWKPCEKYKFENVLVAAPRTKQVRIKVLYTAICHTDVTTSKLKIRPDIFPIVLGHEASGIVESVGEGVTKVKAGDHVLPYCLGQCDHCYNCINDLTNMCKSRPLGWGVSPTLVGDPEPHFTTVDGTVLNRLMAVSTFSEYTVVHEEHVVKLDPELDLEKACLLACGVSTGIGAVWNVAKVIPGATVAVMGLGTIGLAVVQACKVAGASRIIGVDTNPQKFEKAKEFGLTDFVNPKELTKPLPQAIQEMTNGGVHFSFECVGNPKVMEDTVESTVPQYGVTVIVGSPPGPQKMSVDVFSLLQGRKITGTSMGGWRIRQLPELAEKCLGKNPEFPVDQFATQRMPFSKINEANEVFHSGECLRCILYLEE